jgi:ABC-type Fe3+/spermidine/putrescine transport system ATPase subunit
MSVHCLELVGIRKSYGQSTVLDALSLKLAAGVNTALVGPSGCGKSTLLRLLAGLEEPDDGTILVDSRLASAPGRIVVPPHQRGISMVFQDLALWPNLTAQGNVLLGLSGAHSHNDARRRAAEALSLCGIESLAARKPAELSGGQQQRVALARAVAARPSFLLFDEPFSSLDRGTKCELLAQINALTRAHGVTVVLVSHDVAEVQAICGRVVGIARAGVDVDQSVSEFLDRQVPKLNPRSEMVGLQGDVTGRSP